jgi:hypothetical protein
MASPRSVVVCACKPLDYAVYFSHPLRVEPSSWIEHVPFAMFLISALQPRVVVELGTYHGVSYCAFCQAVKELGLDTRCYAVDTWQGDAHSGFYEGSEVLEDLRAHHDPLYASFSRLIQSTFDEALGQFQDHTIDLLHIDGCHTYQSVKHDFEGWLPKMSTHGVVLFHDTCVRAHDFGVWRLWAEVSSQYPHFEFVHGEGLGLLAVNQVPPGVVHDLVTCSEEERRRVLQLFQSLGQGLRYHFELQQALEEIQSLSARLKQSESQLEGILASKTWHIAQAGLAVYKAFEAIWLHLTGPLRRGR